MCNEMHSSSEVAPDRSSLHPWFLRLQQNFYSTSSKQAVTESACEAASHYAACLL